MLWWFYKPIKSFVLKYEFIFILYTTHTLFCYIISASGTHKKKLVKTKLVLHEYKHGFAERYETKSTETMVIAKYLTIFEQTLL